MSWICKLFGHRMEVYKQVDYQITSPIVIEEPGKWYIMTPGQTYLREDRKKCSRCGYRPDSWRDGLKGES